MAPACYQSHCNLGLQEPQTFLPCFISLLQRFLIDQVTTISQTKTLEQSKPMLLLQTLRDPICHLHPLVSRKQPEYGNTALTPSYIPLESGRMEGYKRLEQTALN
jgi:hypothetical protein